MISLWLKALRIHYARAKKSLIDLVHLEEFVTMHCAKLSHKRNNFVICVYLYVLHCAICTHQLIVVMHIACSPVQEVADSWRTGVATNVIFNLALGEISVIIPYLPLL